MLLLSKACKALLDCQVCLLCGQTLWQEVSRPPAWLKGPAPLAARDLSLLPFWLCPSCLARLPLKDEGWQAIDGTRIPLALVFNYEDPIRQACLQLKFAGQRLLADLLAAFAAYRLRQLAYRPQGLIPLPLGPKRKKERGYNQATLICQALAPYLGAEILDGCLLRVRDTQPQTRMPSYRARQANVRGAFALHPNFAWQAWQDKPLLLVDDIYTSGASLSAAAQVLWQADLPLRALAIAQQDLDPSFRQTGLTSPSGKPHPSYFGQTFHKIS